MENPTTPRAAIYIRVSRVGQRDTTSASYQTEDAQRERCEAYAVARGYQVVDVVSDVDVSGGKWDRQGLNRVLDMADAGEIDAVIVYRLSRLGRGLRGVLKTVETLQATQVGLMSVSEGIDLTNAAGRMLFNVLASFDQYEREIRAEYWEDTRSRARARGVLVGPTPYGYLRHKGGADSGKLYPHPEEGPVVADMYRRRASGETHAAIGAWLDDAHPRPKGIWHRAHVRRLLSHRVYLGEVNQAGDRIEDAHPPLVDAETWQAAQDVRTRPAAAEGSAYQFKLSGILRCAGCGRVMSGNSRVASGQAPTYGCIRHGVDGNCDAPASINADRAEGYVIDELMTRLRRQRWNQRGASIGEDLAGLDKAVSDAQAALESVATDPGLRAAMGDEVWRASVERHAAVVEQCKTAALAARTRQAMDDLAQFDPAEIAGDPALLRAALESSIVDCRVTRGRGMLPAERISIVFVDSLDIEDPIRVLPPQRG